MNQKNQNCQDLSNDKSMIYLFSNCDHLGGNLKYKSILDKKIIPRKGDMIFLLNTCQPLKMAFKYFDYQKWQKDISINVIMRSFWYRNITSYWGLEQIVKKPEIYNDLYTIQSDPEPNLQRFKLSGDIENLNNQINWSFSKNYPYENKYFSPTTGYFAVNILEQLFKDYQLILVDFYGDLDNSSTKFSGHNWKFENEWLKTKNRIFIN